MDDFTPKEKKEYEEGLEKGYSPATMKIFLEKQRKISQDKTERIQEKKEIKGTPVWEGSKTTPAPKQEEKKETRGKTIDEIADIGIEKVKSVGSSIKKKVTSPAAKSALRGALDFLSRVGEKAQVESERRYGTSAWENPIVAIRKASRKKTTQKKEVAPKYVRKTPTKKKVLKKKYVKEVVTKKSKKKYTKITKKKQPAKTQKKEIVPMMPFAIRRLQLPRGMI